MRNRLDLAGRSYMTYALNDVQTKLKLYMQALSLLPPAYVRLSAHVEACLLNSGS